MKYNPNLLFETKGIRNGAEYGYLKSIKELPQPDCKCLLYDGWQFNSMNKKMIRYDEVLLWKAEVLIQLDRWNESLVLINKIRERAAKSTARLVKKMALRYLITKLQPINPVSIVLGIKLLPGRHYNGKTVLNWLRRGVVFLICNAGEYWSQR
ncbi:RagB/SusD family nutrient uptake outer membrane protein [Sphingobacterium sp. E70]|uniref:RagB/SusD family nutrient uptake outer membrane protein n=1 Tax=Sphingobacterium sp. E70 TaxID=2853439 RepID=UPI00359C5766